MLAAGLVEALLAAATVLPTTLPDRAQRADLRERVTVPEVVHGMMRCELLERSLVARPLLAAPIHEGREHAPR